MFEVTRQNFDSLFPKIEYAIENADFISIDTEFTGLYYDEHCKPSLFDNSAERYAKLRYSVQKFTLSQIGLTMFVRNAKDNCYSTQTYHFYLFPFPFGSYDPRFSVQTSSLEFLKKNSFDFNKWVKQGIPFLNNIQERNLTNEMAAGYLFSGLNNDDETELQSLCSKVAAWLPNSKVGDILTLSLPKGSESSYVYHTDLRMRFAHIWTSRNPFDQIVVEHVDKVKRQLLERENHSSHQEYQKQQIIQLLGFTRVFRLLQISQKPVVGHNLLMDLIFMYEKFHNPLPDSYAKFKQDIHKMFPSIFDTKHIHYCIKRFLESALLFTTGNLKDLYDGINQNTTILTMLQPKIKHTESGDFPEASFPHQAGYDSYMCGVVFLRLCHFLHFQESGSSHFKPCSFKDYLVTMKKFKNSVNLIRAMVSHIKLDGEEVLSLRPPLIFVQSTKAGTRLISQQLAAWFSMYGQVDIQMINSREAIVAATNFHCAREIISAFRQHPLIKVSKYRFWEHSKLGQRILWGSLAIATVSCLVLLYNA
ncbi:poly(A)-specific ribonuclease PARN-like domain-containing protein 1 [Biomphalaria pfeifferi]|uniref:Poly(A)-specific ribonuclease PARN-like domain-containing protein 1 n=1 Tax=Biomphalaria pfeifferi TaxID=112525 RepID=A0AAD8EYN5_BIOPF|nr:poly(A)-specific ribonuclease PARN-like domain-containing protein 1 [Biomphalaria pfeifferi]